MAATFLLDRQTWDLVLDTTGNIAVATEPYSTAQDVASECRLFAGEAWFDTARGIPYFDQILGGAQPIQALKSSLAQAAMLVDGVTSAQAYLNTVVGREVTGQIQFATGAGVQAVTL